MKRALLMLLILFTASPAQAVDVCQCTERPLRDDINGAFAIFSGTVTGIRREFNPDRTRVEFNVHASWRRVKTSDYAVYTQGTDLVALAREGITCGMEFQRGKTYLVYAWRTTSERGYPWVSRCSHSKLLTEAAGDIAQLGTPVSLFDTPRTPDVPRDFTPTPLPYVAPLPIEDKPLPGTDVAPAAPEEEPVEPETPPAEVVPPEVFEWNTGTEHDRATTVPVEILDGILQQDAVPYGEGAGDAVE